MLGRSSPVAESVSFTPKMQEPLRLYEFFLFERSGRLLFQQNFVEADKVDEERGKLVYGVLFSLKQMIPTLSPPDSVTEEGIRSYTTGGYTMHAYESPTGYRFALLTNPATSAQQTLVRNTLEKVYSEIFVESVMLDPTAKPGSKIASPLFTKLLQETFRSIGTLGN